MSAPPPPPPATRHVDRVAAQESREADRRGRSFGPRWWRERSGGLRWILGASYMRVTLTAVVIVELLGLALLAQGVLYTHRRFHPVVAERLGPVAARLLEADGDPLALQAFIERPVSVRDQGPPLSATVPRPPNGYTAVLDADGAVWFDNRVDDADGISDEVAGDATNDASPLATVPPTLGATVRGLAERAMASGTPRTRQGPIRTVHAAPLRADDGAVIGALLQTSTLQPATPGLVLLGLGGLAVATVIVVVIGTVFGLYASRPLARRIEELATAADAWSKGDFSRAVRDANDDELGRLSRRLDRMALQLRDLVRARQALAGSHERTRIARELHDSVKQQVFAASMRLGAARSADGEHADTHLAAAETLVHRAQQELSDLIHELRPTSVEARPIDQALRELVAEYEDAGVPVLRFELGSGASPPAVAAPATTALYRIAQEALTNAVRHAEAGAIVLRLRADGADAVLEVEDDGRGFALADAHEVGIGLSSMAARAAAVGGTMRIHTRPGQGTRLEARVPAGVQIDDPSIDEASAEARTTP